ncbi:hypothetical protein GCM10010462_13030 [Microbacterium dextranolyticum]|uniref:TIGR03086 family protein n=2 Tax=Microbacterium dextranolyticum TaxID=36806 RepID=A0A9W6M4U9_9MICO|nr:hypothetical protein GCM10017591_00210 [Microbacterium dextranolyticum]
MVSGMNTNELFLQSDAALRSVIDRIDAGDLAKPAPAEWTTIPDPTFRDILSRHAYDEAWIPDVLAGASAADGDPFRDVDLLGDEPIASYDRINDTATAAVQAGVAPGTVFHFTYGDYSAAEGFAHLATYRAFQAWLIAKHLGIPFAFSPELIAGLNENVVAHADEWRAFGVFPPAIDPPEGADDETRLLCAVGYWIE